MPSARIIKALLCGALFVSPLGASARWVVVEPGSTNAAVISMHFDCDDWRMFDHVEAWKWIVTELRAFTPKTGRKLDAFDFRVRMIPE